MFVNLFRSFFGLSLSFQMLLAIILAIASGLFFGEYCNGLAPWGNAYIMVLKMTTIPYLFCAVIHGVGKLAIASAKNVLQKGALFIGGTWVLNILVIYLGVSLFPSSRGAPLSTFYADKPIPINFAELLIPANIFYSLANNIIPAVVAFGLLVGLALMRMESKQPIMTLLETLVDALTQMTAWIAKITPIGTFLIIAAQVGTIELTTVKQMSTYLILYILTTVLVTLWIFPRIVHMFTGLKASSWIKRLFPILLMAYTTNLLLVTLPFLIELIKKEVSAFCKKEELVENQVQGIVSIIFNLPFASLFLAVFVFFIAKFYQVPLPLLSQAQLFLTIFLTGLGSVGIGSWLNSLSFILSTLGLPLEATDLFLATIPFTAGFQSALSAMQVASLAFLITLACHRLISFRYLRVLKWSAITLVPIAVLALLFKAHNPLPAIANPHVAISDIEVKVAIPTRVYTPQETLPKPRSGDVFQRILTSKVLRVGYNTNAVPFLFKNSQGHLSGYDLMFAYALAYDLGCALEFVPLHLATLDLDLNRGLYDIAMSGISITEKRLQSLLFSTPYQEGRLVFVTDKKTAKGLSSLDTVLERPSLKLTALKGSAYADVLFKLAPKSRITLLENYQDFLPLAKDAVLIRGEAEAIAWLSSYPALTLVVPDPSIGQDSLGYAIAANAERFAAFLNLWLTLKSNEGFTQDQYNLWVLGRTEVTTPKEPRWSIVRDVLHWTE